MMYGQTGDGKSAASGQVPAYLTIYISLTLMVVLSLCLVLIQGVRQNTVRVESEYIFDIGLNSVLAEYHRELLKQYNLFYIDTSYGSNYPSYYNTEAHLREYVEKNVTIRDENILSFLYMDLLDMEFAEVEITGVTVATDDAGYHFQKQAIEAIKDDIGFGIVDTVLSWASTVEGNSLLENNMDEEWASAQDCLKEYKGKEQLEDKSWVNIDVANPVADVQTVRESFFLNLLLDEQVSSKTVATEEYISARRASGMINEGNIGDAGKLTISERILFHEYMIQYAGNYTGLKKGAALDYQLEYLLFGNGQDGENLRSTALALSGLREVANMIYLTGCTEKKEAVTAVATILAAALQVPEVAPVFEALILLGWSYLESLEDVKCLLRGEKVPLLKDDASWKLDLDSVFSLGTDSDEQGGSGLSYTDYLRLLIYFADLETVTFRFMDLMEMDIRSTPGNERFRIDGCVDYLEAEAEVVSGYGYRYFLRRIKGY